METKRFIGNDMSRLYERVRKELGRDAVILRTRTLARDGDSPLIELVAGPPAPEDERLDVDLQRTIFDAVGSRLATAGKMTIPELEALLAEQAGPARASRTAAAATPRMAPPETAPLPFQRAFAADEDAELLDDGVRPLLPGLTRPNRESADGALQVVTAAAPAIAPSPPPAEAFPGRRTRTPHSAALATQLHAAGLSPAAIEAVLREAPGETNPARAIARTIDSREVTFPEIETTAIVTVLGGPGSGRTTALMKMALDCADSGRESILVAADSQRMGARQQMHAFGEAAGLQVLDAHDASGVSSLAARVPRGTCLFVDIPAGSFHVQPLPGVVNYAYLAVPAHWQASALEAAIETCADASFDGCVLTFADLAPSIAAAISLVIDSPLGLAFASSSRDIADGMGSLDVAELVSGLFPLLSGESTNADLVATA